ncbi:prepilin-type N-terminal cleavage/methylation domain-containing protein [Magnetospirillum sp. 15-1]|uniref:prepilin-type N-terminal cleavage/methylation domain-containing protein n=1 Tax=Magnetospirillum sp. 15-1 TaxID=1979370 RepID=UPI00241338F2|nr:prepilin-type N-terminal cleavage/methylation domain-containing protein [Magnetospirillum sp. 15-1]
MRLPADSGFTLVELLVSLALLGMAGLLVVAGLGGAHRAWDRTGLRARGAEAAEGAETVLRYRMEGLSASTRRDGGALVTDFQGGPSSVTFLAPPGDGPGPGALRRYTLGLASSGALVLSSAYETARDPSSHRDEVLLQGAQSLDIAYFGSAPPDNAPRWRDGWQNRPTPPELIRVRVRFPPGDRRWWPDLVVHPMADVDTECALDSGGDRCRGR